MLEQALAKNLRAIMIEKGYKNESDYAKAVGTSQKTINNLLNGRYAVKLSTVGDISDSLKIPMPGLLADIPSPTIENMRTIGRLIDSIGRLSEEDYSVVAGVVARLAPGHSEKEGLAK